MTAALIGLVVAVMALVTWNVFLAHTVRMQRRVIQQQRFELRELARESWVKPDAAKVQGLLDALRDRQAKR